MDCARGRAAPQRRAVPGGQHGPQGPRRHPVRPSGGHVAVITTARLVVETLASTDPADDRVGTRIVASPGRDIGLEYRAGASMTVAIKLFPDTYVDSVVQLRGMRAMREVDGVEWASAAMATPANVETLHAEGVDRGRRRGRRLQRLLPGRQGARTTTIAAEALAAGESAVTSSGPAADGGSRAADGTALAARRGARPARIQCRGDLGARRLRRAGRLPGAVGGPARPAVQRQRAGRQGGGAQGPRALAAAGC